MSNAITNELINIQNSTSQMNATRERSQELDQDAFLRLMMEQLKHQDPTSPMDSTQFLSEQAQFTQISELQKLNSNLASSTIISQASSIIGKEVVIDDPNVEGGYIKGIVECASFDANGNANLVVNGNEYPMSKLIILGGTPTAQADTETPVNNTPTQES